MTPDERAALVISWRERGRQLNLAAVCYRNAGDPEYAEELEQAADDWLACADRMEAGLPIPQVLEREGP